MSADTDRNGERDASGALSALRSLRMPDGARERMLGRAERGIRVRRAVRRGALAGAGAAALGAVLWVVAGSPFSSDLPLAELLAARGVTGEEGPLGAGADVYAGSLRVAADGRVELRTAGGATVAVEGPASLSLGSGELSIHEGAALVDGMLTVDAPSCRVAVDGRAQVSIDEPAPGTMSSVSVTVFAGTAQRLGPAVACHFEDLTVARRASRPARAAEESPDGLAAPRPGLRPAPIAPRPDPGLAAAPSGTSARPIVARSARAPGPGTAQDPHAQAPETPAPAVVPAPAPEPAPSAAELELAEQVRQYDAALDLLPSDPSAAVARFRAMRIRWPSSALREQIDLRVVQGLVQLGRDAEARREASAFVDRHPRSRHAGEMNRIITPPAQP